MNKTDRLNKLIKYYAHGKPTLFAKLLGVAPSTISSWLARGTLDYDLIFTKCENLSSSWLLTGEGEMLRNDSSDSSEGRIDTREMIQSTPAEYGKGIPIIPAEAMAGVFAGEVMVYESEYEWVRIPGLDADFIIRINGDSMEPEYFRGDYVACKLVPLSDIFFQWGAAYVINTDQGVLLKKVRESNKKGCIKLVSVNTDYDPFLLHYSHIYSVALVKGLIRLYGNS